MPPVRGQWVRRLKPAAPLDVDPVCLPETIAQAVGQVGQEPVDWAVDIAHRLALRSIELEPEFGNTDASVRTLRLGTESAAVRMLVGIDAGGLDRFGATPEAEPMMRDYVHRRMPLEKIWASIRHGHASYAEYYMAACRDLVELGEQPEQLELVSRVLFEFVNAFSSGVGDVYHEEEQRWLTSAAAARDETVRAALSGDDVDVRASSRILRYDLSHQFHIALILCQEGTGAVDATGLHKIAGSALEQLGATSSLVMPVGRTELWAWGGSRTPFGDLATLAAEVDLHGVRAVAGNPGRDVEGFRRSHLEAQEAARVVLLTDPPVAGIVTYASISLLALLTANPDHARAFMHHELGGLAGDDPQGESLRETVLTFLDCRRSPQAAAAQLFVAKNTVAYRIKRAEALLGRSLDERQPELWAALLLARALGTATGREAETVDEPVAAVSDIRSASVPTHKGTSGLPPSMPRVTEVRTLRRAQPTRER